MAKSQFTKRKNKFFVAILILLSVLAVTAGVGVHFYFGHYFEASDISDSLTDQLTIASSFTVDDILESEKYSYGWMKSNIDVEVLAYNPLFGDEDIEHEEPEYIPTKGILDYEPKTRTFTVCGVGSGIIDFRNSLDSSVALQIPFSTRFAIEDTIEILKENYPGFFDDGLIIKEEIETVTELRLTAPRIYNVGEFFICPNLNRIILQSDDLLQLNGLDKISKDITFYVTESLYGEYISSTRWADYIGRVFPIVDLSDELHTLVFEFRGGQLNSAGKDATRTFSSVEDGGKIDLNKFVIERTGYTFCGWFTSDDNGFTLTSTRIYEDYVFQTDTKLYAYWEVNEYKIVYHDTFVLDLPENQLIKYDQGSSISDKVLERTGYTFIGWALSEGSAVVYNPGQAIINLSADNGAEIHLYAVWAANTYTIVYNGNGVGVTNVPSRQEGIPFDSEVQLREEVPVWTGRVFLGWATESNATDIEYVPGQTVRNLVSDSDGQVTLYAIWSTNTYTIEYNANGGSNAPTTQENLVYGKDVKLSTVVPTWTGRVFLGWAKQSNAATATYSSGSTVSNLVAEAGGIVTLYAVWAMDTFRIEYDANGGTNAPATSTYIEYDSTKGEKIVTGKPNRTGYTFIGWSYAKDNSVDFTSDHSLTTIEINNMYSCASGSPKVVKLYACWSAYPIAIKEVSNDRTNIKDSRSITVTVDFAPGSRYSYSVTDNDNHINISSRTGSNISTETFNFSVSRKDKDASGTITITVTDNYSHAFYSNDYNYTTDGGCFVAGTLITMGDGSQKKIEDIQVGDMVLTWNFITGGTEIMPVSQYYLLQDNTADVLTLHFSDNTQTTIVYSHGFFDYTLNEFVFIDCENYKDYLGHEFIKYDNQKIQSATLVSVEYRVEKREFYAIVTACNYNAFAEGFMSLTKPFIDGIFTCFEVGEDLMYDKNKMQADIDTYGLYTYEEALALIQSWGFDVFPYEYFLAVNVQYYKILLGKGIVTVNDIIFLITEMIAHG